MSNSLLTLNSDDIFNILKTLTVEDYQHGANYSNEPISIELNTKNNIELIVKFNQTDLEEAKKWTNNYLIESGIDEEIYQINVIGNINTNCKVIVTFNLSKDEINPKLLNDSLTEEDSLKEQLIIQNKLINNEDNLNDSNEIKNMVDNSSLQENILVNNSEQNEFVKDINNNLSIDNNSIEDNNLMENDISNDNNLSKENNFNDNSNELLSNEENLSSNQEDLKKDNDFMEDMNSKKVNTFDTFDIDDLNIENLDKKNNNSLIKEDQSETSNELTNNKDTSINQSVNNSKQEDILNKFMQQVKQSSNIASSISTKKELNPLQKQVQSIIQASSLNSNSMLSNSVEDMVVELKNDVSNKSIKKKKTSTTNGIAINGTKSGRVSNVAPDGTKKSAAAQVREFIYKAIPNMTSTELALLQDTNYCKSKISLAYPLFMKVNYQMEYKDQASFHGKKRYARQALKILNEEYYVCNHIFVQHIKKVETLFKELNLITE